MDEIDRKIYEYNQEIVDKYHDRENLTESESAFYENAKLDIKKFKVKYGLA